MIVEGVGGVQTRQEAVWRAFVALHGFGATGAQDARMGLIDAYRGYYTSRGVKVTVSYRLIAC